MLPYALNNIERYWLLSKKSEKIVTKFELVGYIKEDTLVSDVIEMLMGDFAGPRVIEDGLIDDDIIKQVAESCKYKYHIKYEGHTIFTNDIFLKSVVANRFKPIRIDYYDNFPEAQKDLGDVIFPAIIRPYGVSDINYIIKIKEYGRGLQAIYECIDKSPFSIVILERYIK